MTATIEIGSNWTTLFREAWPRSGAKRLAIALGCNVETARNYIDGRRRITADALLTAAEHDAALLAALEHHLHALRARLAPAALDLAGDGRSVAGDAGAAGGDRGAGMAGAGGRAPRLGFGASAPKGFTGVVPAEAAGTDARRSVDVSSRTCAGGASASPAAFC